jgi:hypothetical protein
MADLHDHVIGVSPNSREDLSNARLHDLLGKYLSGGYAVIYAADPVVSSPVREKSDDDEIAERSKQNTNAIVRKISRHIGSNKIKRYLQRGLLYITDPDTIFPADASIKRLLNSMNSYVENLEAKTPKNIEGKVFFNSPGNFFQAKQFDKFLEFEHTLGKEFDGDFHMICWYRRKWLQSLSFSQLVHLIDVHNRTVHSNVQFQTWNADRTIEVISEGLDKAIEQDHASDIILETMRRRFNLDRSTIISSPDLFEDTLKRMSPDSADSIIDTINADFAKKLSFDTSLGTSRKPPVRQKRRKGKGYVRRGRNNGNRSKK